MTRRPPAAADRRLGRRTLRALQVVTIGMMVVQVAWMCTAVFLDLPLMPTWPWVLAVLVAPAARVVYWRPERRGPDPQSLLLTGVSAGVLGLVGAFWGSWLAPAIGAATIVAALFAPKAGGRRTGKRRVGTRGAR